MELIEVETAKLRGSYDELVEAGEDIDNILSTSASNVLDLTSTLERWLVGVLEEIELTLARALDSYERPLGVPDGRGRSAAIAVPESGAA